LTLGSVAVYDREGTHLSMEATQSKRLALLAYLASGTGLHRRDKLVALFWPESDHAHARASLNRAVHYLRSLMGEEALESVGREAIRLDLDRVHVDVWFFRRAVASGDLRTALSLYQGDFLDGVFLPGLEEFGEWVEGERRALRDSAESAAHQLADAAAQEGTWGEALTWARRAVDLDPYDEGGMRRLIEATAESGDRVEALKIFEDFRATLASEFGIEPPKPIEALVARIRDRPTTVRGRASAKEAKGEEADGGPLPSPPKPVTGGPAVVGRRRPGPGGKVLVGLPAVAVVLVAAAVVILRSAGVATAPTHVSVAVAPFQNRSGDASPEGFVTALQAEIVWRIANSVSASVVTTDDSAGADAAYRGDAGENPPAGIGVEPTLAVTGEIHAGGDSAVIHAQVVDRRATHAAHVLAPIVVARTGSVATLRDVADRVAAAVASHVDLGPEASLYTPPSSMEAHREFRRGVELHAAGQGRRAIVHLTRAAELDPGFTRSLLSAAHAHYTAGRLEDAARVLDLLQRMRGTLRPLEVRELDFHLAAAGPDVGQAVTAVRRLAQMAPAMWSHEAGIWELRVNRPTTALAYFERVVPGVWGEGVRDRPEYWSARSEALHRLGRDEEALDIALEGRRRFPESGLLLEREIAALAGLGRVEDAIDHIWEGAATRQWLCAWRAALELRAHGHPEAALQAARSATRLNSDPLLRARALLHFEGREDEARSRIDALAQAHPDNVDYVGMSGVLAARRRDFAAILDVDHRLELWDEPGVPGRNTLWRARIAAARGEQVTAVRLLGQAHDEGMYFSEDLHRDIGLEPLRGYHAFQELLRARDDADGGHPDE
jgi:DNA-binding SARP family transcriptional activator/TolB-like protein